MVLSPRRILWPTDFSALSLHGARYARAFRDAFGAALHVLHVLPPPLMPDMATTLPIDIPVLFSEKELLDACRTRLTALLAEQFGDAAGVVGEVLLGNPWPVICRYAKDAEIDLVIVATHGHTGLRHVLIGGTAERIVQHAPCPVLVVKNPEKDFVAP
jgi:nucleotide-binding universal stress UspA family protein